MSMSPLELIPTPPAETTVFVSWATPIGERFGRRVALAVRETFVDDPGVFFSPFSLRAGDEAPSERIFEALRSCSVIVPILTWPRDVSAWVTFETAFAYGAGAEVVPLYCVDPPGAFAGPMQSQFQGVVLQPHHDLDGLRREKLEQAFDQIAVRCGTTRHRKLDDREFSELTLPPESSELYLPAGSARGGAIVLEESHDALIEENHLNDQDTSVNARRSDRLTVRRNEIS